MRATMIDESPIQKLNASLFRKNVPVELRSLVSLYLGLPLSNFAFRTAVKLWFSNKVGDRQRVIKEFGHISDWNVSQVTDMNEIF
jgi:hypothetical protein